MSSEPVPLALSAPVEGDSTVSRRAAVLRALIAAALLAAIVPAGKLLSLAPFPGCMLKLLTGVPCPGCGMTRAMVCLCHGDLVRSLRFHPLGVVLGGMTLSVLVGSAAAGVTGRDPLWRFLERRGHIVAVAFVVALVATWVVRAFIVPSWSPDAAGPGPFSR